MRQQTQHPGAVAREEASRSCSLGDDRRSFDTKQLPYPDGYVNSDLRGIPYKKSSKKDSPEKIQALDARSLRQRELNKRLSELRQRALQRGRSRYKNERDIEDIVQDAMLRLSERYLEEVIPFPEALLYKMMRNILVDRHRYAEIRPEETSDDMDTYERNFLPELAQDDKHPIWELIEILQEISIEYSATLRLLGEEYTTSEIAHMLNIPAGTVSSRIARGRESLREKLAE